MRGARFLAMMVALCANAALAQPSQKPMQFVVPFAPGGSADGIARVVALELGKRLERTVVVENKAGAAGALGLSVVAKSAPDGDTLGLGAPGALVINPHFPGALLAEPLRDLAPIAKLIDIPIVIIANPATGPKSVRELIERAKASPAGLTYGSTGVNSSQHLAMELLRLATGANLVHVPYRGSAPAVTDVLGGQIPLASVDLTSAFPHIESGRVLALGLVHAQRSALVPNIPTVAEGGVPGYGISQGFMGLFAPAGVAAPIVQRLSKEIGAIMALPDVQARVRPLAVQVAYANSDDFAKFLSAESAHWKQVIQSGKLIR
ncbi:MAG: tripartite tricarboxylate transporter substrate binding protein [Proteobacteria bacterium]|nr:tripartite tricarboxylate transporter substrate binding protein [Pseudomonadota bacterium]